ncbi:MAG TPA: hypothetical protein VF177_19950 [Anaerolineae bacterium]
MSSQQLIEARESQSDNSRQLAAEEFQFAYSGARVHRLWSKLIGRANHLCDLGNVREVAILQSRRYAGIHDVPIQQIRGSEGRSHDFSNDFRPLQSRTRQRWVNVAAARQQGLELPPVELVQVGNVYYVRDGHHRISVASARGETAVDAEVTVWDVPDAVASEICPL